jgi:serine protease Do
LGEVIGVNSQIATSTGDYNGVGFALPAREAAQVYEQIRSTGKVQRGYLGVLLESVRREFAQVYGLDEERGAIVTDVRDNDGPAAAAGIRSGDVIVEFDGRPVTSAQDLIAKVGSTLPERSVNVVYLRENGANMERRSVVMRLGERPPRAGRSQGDGAPSRMPIERSNEEERPFGLTLAEVSQGLATALRIEGQGGLVVREINPESFIADVKMTGGAEALTQGDIIMRINRRPVTSLEDFSKTVRELKRGDAVVMHVLTPISGGRSSVLKIVQFTVQ